MEEKKISINFEIVNEETLNSFLGSIDFEKQNGLIPAVAQDYFSKEVLMLAFMNREAVRKTVETGYAHYFSRSRNTLWKKGSTSGHVQKVKEIFLDCDRDSLLLKVIQTGPACHTGYSSCFYSKATNLIDRESASAPDGAEGDFIRDIEKFYSLRLIFNTIKSRAGSDPSKSYVEKLLNSGIEKIGKKLQEESLELILSLAEGDNKKIVYEASDLLFFYMVLLVSKGVDISLIVEELKRREGVSGIDEKNSRKFRPPKK